MISNVLVGSAGEWRPCKYFWGERHSTKCFHCQLNVTKISFLNYSSMTQCSKAHIQQPSLSIFSRLRTSGFPTFLWWDKERERGNYSRENWEKMEGMCGERERRFRGTGKERRRGRGSGGEREGLEGTEIYHYITACCMFRSHVCWVMFWVAVCIALSWLLTSGAS